MTLADITLSGCEPGDPALLRLERDYDHRVGVRSFVLDYLPAGSTGAELGVYTGLFSALLAREHKIAEVTFVDPWWLRWGDCYPEDWGRYSDFGRVTTRAAHELAVRRITRHRLTGRSVAVALADDWLGGLPDYSLDWVYVDMSLDAPEVGQTLTLLDRKVSRDHGLIIGDDWWADGVFAAVNDFLRDHRFDLLFADGWQPFQWMLRRAYQNRRPGQEQTLRADVGFAVQRAGGVG